MVVYPWNGVTQYFKVKLYYIILFTEVLAEKRIKWCYDSCHDSSSKS